MSSIRIVNGPAFSNDMARLAAEMANIPLGGALQIEGRLEINAPLVVDRAISVICPTRADYICPRLESALDAIVVKAPYLGFKSVHLKLNVFGGESACRTAVALERVDNSKIEIDVRCGATNYAASLLGCLSNDIRLISSSNDPSPEPNAGMQRNHLFLGYAERVITIFDPAGNRQETVKVYTNANHIRLVLEGGGNGVITDRMNGEGNNWFTGTVEGLRPSGVDETIQVFSLANCGGASLRDLHLELNGGPSVFESCVNLTVDGVKNAEEVFAFSACRSVTISGYHGSLDIDAATTGVSIDRVLLNDKDSLRDAAGSAEATGSGASFSSFPDVLDGSVSRSGGENTFCNPFLDIWSNGPVAPPDGVSLRGLCKPNDDPLKCNFVSREPRGGWPGNPTGVSALFRIHKGSVLGPEFDIDKRWDNTYPQRWLSLLMPILAQQGATLLLKAVSRSEGTEKIVASIPPTGEWTVIRRSFLAPETHWPYLRIELESPSNVNTVFLVGGLTVVDGVAIPRHLCDHGRRAEHIVKSVAHAPAFVGQRALVNGQWHIASGVASNSDWTKI